MSLCLQLVPPQLVRAYHRAMLNIHPALLPAFGGKGFYGERVHKVRIRCASSPEACITWC